MTRQLSLSTADLSEFEIRRDFLTDPSEQDASYVQAYDRTTLWYDSFWRDGRVILICPKLMNLARLIKTAQFMLDGRPTKNARLRRYSRHDVIELESSHRPAEVSVAGKEFEVATPVSRTELGRFAGMNAHFTMSLDNDPKWIRDFAFYHRETQGLQAMVLFDNGSTRYPMSVIEDALQDAGLSDYAIVSVPLPYGRSAAGVYEHKAKFLHTSLMNVARLRFLGHARAVLNADIDELIWTEGTTVFDKTVKSRLGHVAFVGESRYPGHGFERRAVHNDHDHISDEPKPFPAKYCIASLGPLGHLSWDVHRLIGLPFKRWFRRRDIGYLHCRRITTDWKDRSRVIQEKGLHPDPRTRALLEKAFSDQEAPLR